MYLQCIAIVAEEKDIPVIQVPDIRGRDNFVSPFVSPRPGHVTYFTRLVGVPIQV
jgi:hypothetical protein